MEVYMPVLGIDGYSVSSHGRVRNDVSGRFLKGSVRPDGYTQITMGSGRTKLLHVLILEAHVGARPTGMLGLHIDDVRSNNNLSNLEWGTPKRNAEQRTVNRRARGVDAAGAKLSRKSVLDICARLDTGEKMKSIASDFGVEPSLIGLINTGQAWQWLTRRSADNARISTHINRARKLDPTKARELVRLRAEGVTRRELADLFGIRTQTVDQILNGTIWSHATGLEAA